MHDLLTGCNDIGRRVETSAEVKDGLPTEARNRLSRPDFAKAMSGNPRLT
jgi:hypothetical protein